MEKRTIGKTRARVNCFAALLALGLFAGGQPWAFSQTAEGLTNADVLRLVKAGLNEETIIKKVIESRNGAKFDTSVDGLIKLKEAGVSDAIINAMIGGEASAPRGVGGVVALSATSDALTAGLYIERAGELVRLEPTFATPEHARSRILVLRGSTANVSVSEPRPRFVFYFPNTLGQVSPAQLILLKFLPKKDQRELKLEKKSLLLMGLAFTYDEIGPSRYVLTPRESLSPGEYAFFNGNYFDFKVLPAEGSQEKESR